MGGIYSPSSCVRNISYSTHDRTTLKEDKMTKPKPTYHPEFQCSVFSISYDFPNKEGVLMMAESNCCDMDGCIAFFKRVDPNVRAIRTAAGGVEDTMYRLDLGEWKAFLPSAR